MKKNFPKIHFYVWRLIQREKVDAWNNIIYFLNTHAYTPLNPVIMLKNSLKLVYVYWRVYVFQGFLEHKMSPKNCMKIKYAGRNIMETRPLSHSVLCTRFT